jgi:flavin reductase (DIM6/NTAB) family NADH-FMN oxidoreductase RutF
VEFDFERMSPAACFDFLTGTVVPRPIALVTTVSAAGEPNAAPYSFFNIMGIEPPVLVLTVLPTADGCMKDTGNNILATREFVVNLVSEDLAEAMNVTCIDAPPGVDELRLAELASAASAKVRVPRLAKAPVAFECKLLQEVTLSRNQFIAIGRIVHAHVADAVVVDAGKHVFDTPGMKLIGGMHGARWYTRTTDCFAMDRPTWATWGDKKG